QGMERPREADQLMAIEQQLTDTLTQAIRAKDTRTAGVVRMLKTRLQERRTAKGFTGQVDDALLRDVIGAYRKQLQHALAAEDQPCTSSPLPHWPSHWGSRGAPCRPSLRIQARTRARRTRSRRRRPRPGTRPRRRPPRLGTRPRKRRSRPRTRSRTRSAATR